MGLEDVGSRQAARMAIGMLLPTDIYDQMRRIDASANALDADININFPDGQDKQAWKNWLQNWKTFYASKLSESGKFSNLFALQELRDKVNSYGLDLDRWYASYEQKTGKPATAPGAPAPMPTVPGKTPPEEKKEEGFLGWVPWWGWALGVLGVGAVGFGFYTVARNMKRTSDRVLDNPEILGALINPAGAAAMTAAAHARPVSSEAGEAHRDCCCSKK